MNITLRDVGEMSGMELRHGKATWNGELLHHCFFVV
jgi:hypothetical protein